MFDNATLGTTFIDPNAIRRRPTVQSMSNTSSTQALRSVKPTPSRRPTTAWAAFSVAQEAVQDIANYGYSKKLTIIRFPIVLRCIPPITLS